MLVLLLVVALAVAIVWKKDVVLALLKKLKGDVDVIVSDLPAAPEAPVVPEVVAPVEPPK